MKTSERLRKTALLISPDKSDRQLPSYAFRCRPRELPKRIPLSDAVAQWGNVGGLVAGFALRDVALIGRSMHDVVAEPYRKGFIPGYDALKEQVLAGGALAMNIAGSGPSVFALASNYEAAVRISGEMKRHFEGLGIGCNSYAGRVSNAGARVVE